LLDFGDVDLPFVLQFLQLSAISARNYVLAFDVASKKNVKDKPDDRHNQQYGYPCQGFHRITVLGDYHGDNSKNYNEVGDD
jgi:hypothetical protein